MGWQTPIHPPNQWFTPAKPENPRNLGPITGLNWGTKGVQTAAGYKRFKPINLSVN